MAIGVKLHDDGQPEVLSYKWRTFRQPEVSPRRRLIYDEDSGTLCR